MVVQGCDPGCVELSAGPAAPPCMAAWSCPFSKTPFTAADFPEGSCIHSHRGSQLVDHDYIGAVRAGGIEHSMSRAGNCSENDCVNRLEHKSDTTSTIDSGPFQLPPSLSSLTSSNGPIVR